LKILQLTKKFPYPLKDGEAIAITNVAKALSDLGCEVSLLSMNTKKHFFDIQQLPDSVKHYKNIQTILVDSEIKLKDAFLNLFSKDSYHISRFVSKAFEQQLIDLLKEEDYDIIQLETLYLAPYIPAIRKHSKALVAMRAHNVEHEIWKRIATNTSAFYKKWYLQHLTEKLRQFEIASLAHYDILVPITARDLEQFITLGYKNFAKVSPIGVDPAQYQADYHAFSQDLSISFIGSLDWMPNLEGLDWFLKKVWPQAIKEFPNLSLHIAGRNPPSWMLDLEVENIKIHGEVPCAVTFVNQHPLTIVPLLSGSGMRAKILEGMALGKVVLTTSVGLEGVDARDKQEVLIANTADEFLATIAYCYEHKNQLSTIGKNAHAFVTNRYDNLKVAKRLAEVYQSYLTEAMK